jgi:hypothetical protein
MLRSEQSRFAWQCSLAGLAILALLAVCLALLRIPSEFEAECSRIGGSFVAGVDGAADLCIAGD